MACQLDEFIIVLSISLVSPLCFSSVAFALKDVLFFLIEDLVKFFNGYQRGRVSVVQLFDRFRDFLAWVFIIARWGFPHTKHPRTPRIHPDRSWWLLDLIPPCREYVFPRW